jgi:hypothetical protein
VDSGKLRDMPQKAGRPAASNSKKASFTEEIHTGKPLSQILNFPKFLIPPTI